MMTRRKGLSNVRFGMWVLMMAFACMHSSMGQTIEAEDGILQGTVKSNSRSGYSGTGYVTGFDADGDKVTMFVDVPRGGVYDLFVRYASPSGDKFNFIIVNDVNLGSVAFPITNVFQETKAGKVFLDAGENSIAVLKEWGYFELDNIRVEPAEAADIYNIAENLVTPGPTTEADSLYDFLAAIYGKVILSGQYTGPLEEDRIKNISGRTPVIGGFDMIDYSPSRVEHGATSDDVERAIEWNAQGGIVTFCWHWNAPKDLIDQPGKEWWRGFYTEATTFDLSKAMNDPLSEEYQLIIRDIDAIAAQLIRLKDAHVPVLWRPLHEAEGMWFWWGAKGPEPCKWLWKLLFERLVYHHGINNLIWTWTSSDKPTALDWYPGDEYVDLIGADIYLPEGTRSSSFLTFDNLATIYGGRKIIALSENGPMPDPERMFVEGAAWSWFATWRGSFITDGKLNPPQYINEVYNHDYVITLDEISELDEIISDLEQRREALQQDTTIVSLGEGVLPVMIYHNPIVDNQLTLTLMNIFIDSHVRIYDPHGRAIFEGESRARGEQVYQFDFSRQETGIYLARITTAQFTKVIRILRR